MSYLESYDTHNKFSNILPYVITHVGCGETHIEKRHVNPLFHFKT